jgi:adenosylcobyric acid synthase
MPGLNLDAKDSLALGRGWARPDAAPGRPLSGGSLDVAVIRLPRISNFTDVDPLAVEPGVALRLVHSGAALGQPDLLVLPGTKATVADLDWLHQQGLAAAIRALGPGTTILGICGGYQILGTRIADTVESRPPRVAAGLGLLPAETVFEPDKVTRWVSGHARGQPVAGYEIHHGRTHAAGGWIVRSGANPPEGCQAAGGRILGTNWHGLLDNDRFRAAFLSEVAARAGRRWASSGISFGAAREARFDRLADAIEQHLDLAALEQLITTARPAPAPTSA